MITAVRIAPNGPKLKPRLQRKSAIVVLDSTESSVKNGDLRRTGFLDDASISPKFCKVDTDFNDFHHSVALDPRDQEIRSITSGQAWGARSEKLGSSQ